uniref:Uncharacterized protein n=1 Tax=Hyaloperonospora arabidopsidis (strain Emoy2) TaxID=559515 RepID=M4BB96_HYAAE
MEGTSILASRKLKPALVWAQVDDHDMRNLANVFVQVYSNRAGAVGGERNHKTNNRVRTKQRVRLGIGKCEKQPRPVRRGRAAPATASQAGAGRGGRRRYRARRVPNGQRRGRHPGSVPGRRFCRDHYGGRYDLI